MHNESVGRLNGPRTSNNGQTILWLMESCWSKPALCPKIEPDGPLPPPYPIEAAATAPSSKDETVSANAVIATLSRGNLHQDR
jgi:hypothetical protein